MDDNKTQINPDSDATQVAAVGSASLSSPGDRPLRPGETIKQRFVLQRLLGVGGMGEVFRALDLRKQEAGDNNPHIAIKILGREFKDHPQALITLQREAKKTQELAHPNIVTVYDFDRDGDLIYLTMEELQGESLDDILANPDSTLNYAQKLEIIREIARGLAYAHSRGIVHSDLKPANIFIASNGRTKILDFGIARAVNQEAYQDSFDAGDLGAVTYPYASLEMLDFDPPHPSDDIYALGIIACELLGGEHPYGGQNAQQVRDGKLLPKLPKLKNPLLRKLLSNALALQRRDRIADAGRFLKRFDFALAGPRRLSVAAVLLVAALVGNYYYLQYRVPGPIPFSSLPQEAQAEFAGYLAESQRALAVGDFQGAVLNIDRAYDIHASNDEILAAIDQVLAIAEDNVANAPDQSTREFYQRQVDETLAQYPAFSNSAEPAVK